MLKNMNLINLEIYLLISLIALNRSTLMIGLERNC